MWQYDNELYHHGVKGMKWGVRRARRAEGKYAKAGKARGAADYERSKGAEVMKKHENAARTLERAAGSQTSKGNGMRAIAAQSSAAAIRARGARVKAERDREAARYDKRANRLTEKANSYATKKRVDLGKAKVDKILKESRKKGFENARLTEEAQRRYKIGDTLGDGAVGIYDRLRGD